MNKLELCQKVVQDAGISTTGMATTLNQTGEYKRVISWVEQAYRKVQTQRNDWLFLREEFSQTVTTNSLSIAGVSRWLTHTIQLDGIILPELHWDDYKALPTPTNTGKPAFFAVAPDRSLRFYPVPDQEYTCSGEYQAIPDVMNSDSAEPIFPEEYHDIIAWKALEMYGAYSGEYDRFTQGGMEYHDILFRMRATEAPEMRANGCLA
jgi:hypothetical protein